jgi:type II secretory pathway pseudopilin PulG
MADFVAPKNAPPGSPRGAAGPPASGLAIAALVLACVFFIPLVPLVGLILALVALVKAPPGGRTLPIVALCIGGASLLLNLSVCAALAIPSYMRYIRRAKTNEAVTSLGRLESGLQAYRLEHGAWPPLADWTPPGRACDQPDRKFPAARAPWRGSPWRELPFSMNGPHYYQYRIADLGGGRIAVEARGDLDCDGEFSLFREELGPDGSIVPLKIEAELE